MQTHRSSRSGLSSRKASASRTPAAVIALFALTGLVAAPAFAQRPGGNWMREYVALRVIERNLKAMPPRSSQGDVDRMLAPTIVGGTKAGASDNPFQVALLNKGVASTYDAQFCGGTLYKARFVVTAAHCSDFVTAGQVQVLTGTRSLDGSGTRRNVRRISIHPDWDAGTFDSDVAVWELTTPATGSPKAPLATGDGTVGDPLLATGWGALAENGDFPIDLQKVTLPLAGRITCNDANSYHGQITANMLCAGRARGGIDTCQGDSGGPLTRGSGNSVLTGITSWGDGCKNLFGVYTRVSRPTIRNFIVAIAGP